MAVELQRKITENKYLIEIIKRFQGIIVNSRLINDSKVVKSLNEFGKASLEKTAAVFEILVNKIIVEFCYTQEKEALISAREFKLDARSLHFSLVQKENTLLKRKNEIFEALSEGKCSIVSKDSKGPEKENYKQSGRKEDTIPKRSISGKHSEERYTNRTFEDYHLSDKMKFSKNSSPNYHMKYHKEALGKRNLNEARSENLSFLEGVKNGLVNITEKVIQIDGCDEIQVQEPLGMHEIVEKTGGLKSSGNYNNHKRNEKYSKKKKFHQSAIDDEIANKYLDRHERKRRGKKQAERAFSLNEKDKNDRNAVESLPVKKVKGPRH